MGTVMLGTEVAKAMKERLIQRTEALKERGTEPKLAILRVGARPDDLSYERGAKKRMELTGIGCQVVELPEDVSQRELEESVKSLNRDSSVHGILVLRPLPRHLDEEPLTRIIDPVKDVDCMSPVNIAKIFSGDASGYAPCTPEAVMEMLDHYGIDPKGKKVTVIGRSMVVGKPLAMLLLGRHATVTICHTRTADLAATCRDAEILVAAAGKAKMVGASMAGEGAVVVDVGINMDPEGNLCGDVDFEAVEPKASFITPGPRGVGSVTTSVLAQHVVRAAETLIGQKRV